MKSGLLLLHVPVVKITTANHYNLLLTEGSLGQEDILTQCSTCLKYTAALLHKDKHGADRFHQQPASKYLWKIKIKSSHWLTRPKAAMDQSEAELQSNQSDYSMTSWVMTSAPETKHPSQSSLCSFLWNKFKDKEKKTECSGCSHISADDFLAWESLYWSMTS